MGTVSHEEYMNERTCATRRYLAALEAIQQDARALLKDVDLCFDEGGMRHAALKRGYLRADRVLALQHSLRTAHEALMNSHLVPPCAGERDLNKRRCYQECTARANDGG